VDRALDRASGESTFTAQSKSRYFTPTQLDDATLDGLVHDSYELDCSSVEVKMPSLKTRVMTPGAP
jgi:hypothetical protein